MKLSLSGNNNQKYTGTISDALDHVLSKQDQAIFDFLRNKYLYCSSKHANQKCAWQDRNKQDFRRQFVDFIKQIAASKLIPGQTNGSNQLCDSNGINNMFQNYLELLIDNKFMEAENVITKYDFSNYPRLLRKLNSFTKKISKYKDIVDENNKNKNALEQLDFYQKIIQNIHESKSLQTFSFLNKKSPYMSPTLSYKLQKQAILSQEKQQFQKICKSYEKIILQLNNQLKKPILEFKYTNIELASFSCKDFKSKFTEQSGIKLKKSLAELIYNISSSKEKKLLVESQKSQLFKLDQQTLTYNLLDNFFIILSSDFQQKHFNKLESYVMDNMPNNKSIKDMIQSLNKVGSSLNRIKEFERILQGLSVTIPSNIQNIISVIRTQGYNQQKIMKLFKREFIYRLMNQINNDKVISGSQTYIQSMLTKYKQFIDNDIIKSFEKLALKAGKQRKILEDLRRKLSEISTFIGFDQVITFNMNPNTTDFYYDLQLTTQKIYEKLQRKNNYKDESKTPKPLAKDAYSINLYQLNSNNIKKDNNNEQILILEQNLTYQLQQCQKLKKKLFELFSTFDNEINKNMIVGYTHRGGYEISRDSFSSYVKKKTDQINKIFQKFEQTKNTRRSNPTIISKKVQVNELIELQKFNEKKQLDIFQLKKQYESLKKQYELLDARLVHAVTQYSKKQNQYKKEVQDLKDQLNSKKLDISNSITKMEIKQTEIESLKRQKKLSENALEEFTKSHHQMVQVKNNKIKELTDKISQYVQKFEKKSNQQRKKVSQMKNNQQRQQQINDKKIQSIQAYWRQEQSKLKQSYDKINNQLVQLKKKSSSQAYSITDYKTQISKYQYKISQLQETTRQQQDEIKTLKDQIQSKKSNAFKKEDEGDQKRSGFRSLKEPDQNPRQAARSISRHKQQQFNALSGKNSVGSQEMISKKELELKLKQNSQKLKVQFQTELAKQLQTQKSQFLTQKSALEVDLTEKIKNLQASQNQCRQLNLQKQKQTQRANNLQQLKVKLEEQMAELKQQKEKIEKQLNDLKQSVAKQEEQDRKKKQQEDRFLMDENNNRELLQGQIKQSLTQIEQLKANISELQTSLAAEKQKSSKLQHTLELSKSQKAALLKQTQEKEQLTLQKQQKIKQMQERNENLTKNVQQLMAKLADAKSKQSQPIVEKPKSELISEYEWKIVSLTNQLKQKQQECDELAGFEGKKAKAKRAHNGVQTENIDEKVKTDKQSSIIESDKSVVKNGQAIAQNTVKVGEQTKIPVPQQIEQSLPIDQSNQQEQTTKKEPQPVNQSHNLEQDRQFIIKDIPPQPNQIKSPPTQLTLQQQNPPSTHPQSQSVQTQTSPIQSDLSQQVLNRSLFEHDTSLKHTHDDSINKLAMQHSLSTAHTSRVQAKQLEERIETLTREKVDLNGEVSKLRFELQNLYVNYKKLHENLVLTQNKIGQSQAKNAQLVKTHQKLLKQLDQFKVQSIETESRLINQIDGLKSTTTTLNQQVQSLKATISQLNKQITNKSSQIRQSQEITGELTKNLEIAQKDLNLFKQEFTNKQLLLKQAQEKIADLIKEKQNYGPDMDILRSQVKDYEYNMQQLKGKNNQQRAEITQLKNKIKTLNQQTKQAKKTSIQQIKKAKLQFNRQLTELQRQKSKLQLQILQHKKSDSSQSSTSSSSNTQLHMEHERLKKQYKILQTEMSSCYSESTQFKKRIKQLEKRLEGKEKELQELYRNLDVTNLELNQMRQNAYSSTPNPSNYQKPISKYLMFDRLFPGQILQDQHQKKYLLSNTIQKRLHRKISKTKLLYKYDALNPASFHNYIDGKQNFLIIIRTINDRLFGAFSTQKFQAKSKQSQFAESFIFSFNSQSKQPINCFNLIRNMEKARSLTYDDFFLIVGNSQIRWKMGQKTVYSNFGITNSYFDPKGTNVEALLQLGEERETDIKGFECFQVCFEK